MGMAKVQIPLKKKTTARAAGGKSDAAKEKAATEAAKALAARVKTLKENSLAGEVYDLLKQRVGQWKEIADKAGVSHSWISKFVNGHIADSSNRRLTDLRDWLKSHPK
jgi:predicted XRE-type DNA-binding protein